METDSNPQSTTAPMNIDPAQSGSGAGCSVGCIAGIASCGLCDRYYTYCSGHCYHHCGADCKKINGCIATHNFNACIFNAHLIASCTCVIQCHNIMYTKAEEKALSSRSIIMQHYIILCLQYGMYENLYWY